MKKLNFIISAIFVLALTACSDEPQEKIAVQAEAKKQEALEKVEKLKETTTDGQRF